MPRKNNRGAGNGTTSKPPSQSKKVPAACCTIYISGELGDTGESEILDAARAFGPVKSCALNEHDPPLAIVTFNDLAVNHPHLIGASR